MYCKVIWKDGYDQCGRKDGMIVIKVSVMVLFSCFLEWTEESAQSLSSDSPR